MVRQNPEEPLRDPTLALLVRFLEENPNLSVVPEFPGPFEMYKLVSKVQSVDRTRFSVLFGSEALAAYHWLKPGSRVSPAVGRLMLYFKVALQSRDPNDRAEMVDQWRSTVTEEAQARGVLDIFRTGAWKAKPEQVKVSEEPKPTAVLAVEKPPAKRASAKKAPAEKAAAKKSPTRKASVA